jgi:hypothetical protein
MKDFLKQFDIGEGSLVVAVGHPANLKYYEEVTLTNYNTDIYFGPAARRHVNGTDMELTKASVIGSKALWVDVDDANYPQCTYPPNLSVWSGHGWHLYWFLSEPLRDVDLIEGYNKALSRDIPTADKACWNANRVLRLPGSLNSGDPPAKVEIRTTKPFAYQHSDFKILQMLDPKTRHKIRTGDRRGYRSRSERDWAVIVDLVEGGARDELILHLFGEQPVGDKYRDPETPREYLSHTISKARDRTNVAVRGGLVEQADGYYDYSKRGTRRVSTFVITPRILLDSTGYGGEDAIMGDISASGYRWVGVTFTRSAFTSVNRLDRETPVAAWQWLGRDDDVRRLLPHLMEQLQEKGMPRVRATPTLGLFKVKNTYYFVGDEHTLSGDDIWPSFEGPIAALPSTKERPALCLTRPEKPPDLEWLAQNIPKMNRPEVMWPMIGWFSAAMVKPWLEEQGYRFPILNVTGTKGSGKTTLLQRVLMPLFGQKDPKSYDAGTTRFVILALLGGTNAIPVAFSEFRYASVDKFLRYILLSYDQGHDPRGRSDQSTVDYPLSAPFTVDGEDLISDPAAQERIVVARLHPVDIVDGSSAYRAYKDWQTSPRLGLGYGFTSHVLRLLNNGDLNALLNRARDDSYGQIPGSIPDRIRNNHVVAYFGCLLWLGYVGGDPIGFDVMDSSIGAVFNVASGKSKTLGDDFCEELVNSVASWNASFRYTIREDGKQLWFQVSSAHNWWMASMRRRGKTALERDAIVAQLRESLYVLPPQIIKNTWMYGIDLQLAQEQGLDIPNLLSGRTK